MHVGENIGEFLRNQRITACVKHQKEGKSERKKTRFKGDDVKRIKWSGGGENDAE